MRKAIYEKPSQRKSSGEAREIDWPFHPRRIWLAQFESAGTFNTRKRRIIIRKAALKIIFPGFVKRHKRKPAAPRIARKTRISSSLGGLDAVNGREMPR